MTALVLMKLKVPRTMTEKNVLARPFASTMRLLRSSRPISRRSHWYWNAA